jgi:SAM-dependent methyltransferase
LADGFFCFNKEPVTQNRCLLIHQEATSNPYMIAYGWPINAAHVREAVRACRPRTILDIGCGNGSFYNTFKDLCTWYYGLEPSPIPEYLRAPVRPCDEQTLVHHDPRQRLPVADASVEMVLFLGSYGQIPNRTEVLRDAWRTVRPGGYLLICMTNYGFWAKRLVNLISGRQLLRHEEIQFCIHDPGSLAEEVCTNAPGAKLILCDSDYMYVPNSPFRPFYRSKMVLKVANRLLRFVIHNCLRQSESGSGLISVFRKEA